MTETPPTEKEVTELTEDYYKRREKEHKKTLVNHYVLKPMIINTITYMAGAIIEVGAGIENNKLKALIEVSEKEIEKTRCGEQHKQIFNKGIKAGCVVMDRDSTYRLLAERVARAWVKKIDELERGGD